MPIYGRLDVDDVGDKLELLLLQGNVGGAVELQTSVREGMRWLEGALVGEVGANILFVGCDDVLFVATCDVERLRSAMKRLSERFADRTGCTFSCGIADDLAGALHNLRLAKLKGKSRTESGEGAGESMAG